MRWRCSGRMATPAPTLTATCGTSAPARLAGEPDCPSRRPAHFPCWESSRSNLKAQNWWAATPCRSTGMIGTPPASIRLIICGKSAPARNVPRSANMLQEWKNCSAARNLSRYPIPTGCRSPLEDSAVSARGLGKIRRPACRPALPDATATAEGAREGRS
jgi:hypothetical protein